MPEKGSLLYSVALAAVLWFVRVRYGGGPGREVIFFGRPSEISY